MAYTLHTHAHASATRRVEISYQRQPCAEVSGKTILLINHRHTKVISSLIKTTKTMNNKKLYLFDSGWLHRCQHCQLRCRVPDRSAHSNILWFWYWSLLVPRRFLSIRLFSARSVPRPSVCVHTLCIWPVFYRQSSGGDSGMREICERWMHAIKLRSAFTKCQFISYMKNDELFPIRKQ